MKKKTQQIIQEALEAGMNETPKSFWDILFYREPSREKLQSSAIVYLTDRVMKAEESRQKAEFETGYILKYALQYIGEYDPKKQREFYNRFTPNLNK